MTRGVSRLAGSKTTPPISNKQERGGYEGARGSGHAIAGQSPIDEARQRLVKYHFSASVCSSAVCQTVDDAWVSPSKPYLTK